MVSEERWFRPPAARSHQSFMWLHLCWRPEKETTWGVSPQAAFLLGWGNLHEDGSQTVQNQSSSNTVQIKDQGKIVFYHCVWISVPSFQSGQCVPLYPRSFSVWHVFSLFLSVKGRLAFLNFFFFTFCFLLLLFFIYKVVDWMDETWGVWNSRRTHIPGVQGVLCRELWAARRCLTQWSSWLWSWRPLRSVSVLCSVWVLQQPVPLWAAPRGDYFLDFRIAIKVDLHQEEPLSAAPTFRTRIFSSWRAPC